MKHPHILSAALMLASVASGADFFPLATGNTWSYKESRFGQTISVRVGLPYFINEKVYYTLTGYTDSPLLVRLNENKDLVYLDQDRQIEVLLTSFEPFEGGWWYPWQRTCTDGGRTLLKRGQHDGPAGSFADVLEIRYLTFSCADAGLQQEQFAENIGMLRRVSQSFTGPRTFDLVSARVGKLRLETAASGQFRVTAEPEADQVAVTLVLESRDPVKLEFASGQEYEVKMRDSDGRVVWTWSADKAFPQALHERTVNGLWMVAVKVPRPVMPGDYTVQAWLTTIGDAPLYAATVPVSLQNR